MSVSVTINEETLRVFLAGPGGQVSRYMLRKAIRVQGAAKRNCPVDTGRLRSSISVSQEFTDHGAVTTVGTDVEYAIFVHEGTRYIAGRPFLRDALESEMA